MMAVKKGLGKGLDMLIPTEHKEIANNKNESSNVKKEKPIVKEVIKEVVKEVVKEVPTEIFVDIKSVEPNHNQPRKYFDEDALIELSDSIKQFGILQPLLVQKKEDYYEIIAGERRWRAARMAGLSQVPVVIRDYSYKEILEISLIENLQREDLNPIEEAIAYQKLIQEFSLKQDEVAERVSKSRAAITNSLRLLKLDGRVQQMLIDDMLSSGHARTLIAIEDGNDQYKISMRVFDEKLSVRETEKLVKNFLNPKVKLENEEGSSISAIIYKEIEEKMKNIVGTKVSIKHKDDNRGKIELEYYSQDELERIVDLITSIKYN